MSRENLVCTVYSLDMRPLHRILSSRALILVMMGKAQVIEEHEVGFRTVKAEYPAPKKIQVRSSVPMPSNYYKPAPLSLATLKIRDKHTCQYCGKKKLGPKELWTIDHIIPQSRGGSHTWENVALACNKCNNKKGSKSLKQSGMTLLSTPRVPYKFELLLKDFESAAA